MEEIRRVNLLLTLLAVYAAARMLQIFPTEVPTLLIVILHVIPPAVFAWIHGRRVYGAQGMLVFIALCLVTACCFEYLGLRTGFPFGHYYFTGVMGPKVYGLPILLAAAYVGVGYAAWVVASLIVAAPAHSRAGVLLTPLVAATAMCAWDLAMDPEWAYIDRAWVWRDGGGFFGVPFSNYFGWLLTTWVFYQIFALWLRRRSAAGAPPLEPLRASSGWVRLAVLLYGLVAAGNVLLAMPSAVPASFPRVITDAAGRQWQTGDITGICLVVSVLMMAPLALVAWVRAGDPAPQPTRRDAWMDEAAEPLSQ